jgi:hypothetical protein
MSGGTAYQAQRVSTPHKWKKPYVSIKFAPFLFETKNIQRSILGPNLTRSLTCESTLTSRQTRTLQSLQLQLEYAMYLHLFSKFKFSRTREQQKEQHKIVIWARGALFLCFVYTRPFYLGGSTVVRQKQDFDNEKLLARQAVFMFQHCMKNVLIGQICFSENKTLPSAGRVRILTLQNTFTSQKSTVRDLSFSCRGKGAFITETNGRQARQSDRFGYR